VVSFQMKSNGATNRSLDPRSGAAANGTSTGPRAGSRVPSSRTHGLAVKRRSALRYATPLSRTATVMFEVAPGLMSHARSMSMPGKFHWSR
jgi:hypothetical protein